MLSHPELHMLAPMPHRAQMSIDAPHQGVATVSQLLPYRVYIDTGAPLSSVWSRAAQ